MDKILYEMRYPKDDPEELQTWVDEIHTEMATCGPLPSFDSFLNRLYQNMAYIPLPSRQSGCKKFVATAIRLSKEYLLDVKIVKHFERISVAYYFDGRSSMGFLKEILGLADDIAIFADESGFEIGLHLEYYTHAVYQKGRRLYP